MENGKFNRPLPIARTIKDAIEEDKKKSKKMKKIASFVSGDYIGEMVKPESGAPFFLIYHLSSNHISSEGEIDLGNLRYEPATGDNLVIGDIVKIPSFYRPYHSLGRLKEDLREYVSKYVDIRDELDREIIITYIMLTWVYDRFTALPYLRIIVDYGTGKSRLLKVLEVCRNSLYTSGLASAAPIFRLIDKYSCTLLIDELELSGKTDKNEDIK